MLAAGTLAAQQARKYTGPRPPKPDVPFLLHAANLIETEVGEAVEEKRKDEMAAVIKGAASPVRTPLPEPIFLFEADKIAAEKLQLYRLTVSKSGNREVLFPNNPKKARDAARPVHLSLNKLDGALYRIEAAEILDPGEYCLSPQGANTVFCFQVY
jgi:hypothetical protein